MKLCNNKRWHDGNKCCSITRCVWFASRNAVNGKLTSSGVPPKPKGQVKTTCKFKLDPNGMLQLKVENANNEDNVKTIFIDRKKFFKQNNASNGDNNSNKNNHNECDESALPLMITMNPVYQMMH